MLFRSQGLAWLTGIGVGMTGLGGLLFGWLSDRVGRRPALVAGLTACAAGNLLCAGATSPALLLTARAVAGLGIGGTWGAGQAMVGETCPPAWRGRFGAIAQSGAPLGLGLAAIIGSFLTPVLGWRGVFVLAAAPVALLPWVRRLPESDLWTEHRATRAAPRPAGRTPAPRSRPILVQLVAPDLAGLFVRAFLLTGFNMSAYWFALIWLPRFLQRERGLGVFGSGWWTLVFVAGSLGGYLSFGWVSDRIGRRPAFTAYCGLGALALAAVALLPSSAGAAGTLAAMFLAGVGTGTWSCYGPYFTELFPTRVRGAALAITMNVTRGVQFLAPVIIARVAGRWGLGGGIALAAGFSALAAGWIWLLPETAGRRLTR